MAELLGLKMQGIRSIGDDAHVISFLNPLTIIQGANGTGKTTTIEALNYVTTGALPQGKMQSFIHNIKLANRSRMDALVQLKFKDVKGNICTATKRLNSSNLKTGKSKSQSDEFTLVVEDKFGNNKSLSSKVVDFNKEMLNLLGVPKAILEHVIFCHQEESNWPLSEPKELKVKFDSIFEVTKYVKALDNIKKISKELDIQIRLFDGELPHLSANCQAKKELLDSHDKSKLMLHRNKESIKKFKAEKNEVETKLKELSKDVELAFAAKHETDIIHSQIHAKRQFLDSFSVEECFGSREDLIEEISRLRSEKNDQQAEKDRLFLIQETEQRLCQAEQDAQLSTRSFNRNEQSLNQLVNTVSMKESQLEKYISIVNEIASDKGLIDVRLEEIRLVLSKSRADLGQIDGCRFLYKKWEGEISAKQSCPLCEHPCGSLAECNKLVQMVRKKSNNLPEETRALEMKIKQYEEEERKLLKVIPFVGMIDSIEKELPKCLEQVKRAQLIVQKEKKSKETIDLTVAKLREKLRRAQAQDDTKNQEHEIRMLQEQLRKMDLLKELDELEGQLESVRWKGRDHDLLIQENSELGKKSVELNNRIHQKTGEQTQIEQKISECSRELNSPRYANAKQQYLDKLIERVVLQSTMQDLNKYWKILDNAIISFHQQKMAQINQILGELWMRVYKGNDIESLKIKSQTVSGGDKRKSYDYSVVMVVDQTEIDMRDHCSAGQKVLASILIRIALADVFSGNCPILALDEPTTNLDADKVENVGVMLKSLIEVRNNMHFYKSQDSSQDTLNQSQSEAQSLAVVQAQTRNKRGLQLLVITHDKRLVDHLFLACRPECIYGLSKDENGISKIRRHKRVCDTNTEFADW